ncbi:PAS domain-containing sensor histidine kinase [Wenyingzhuangia sp. IMCC45467]
MQSAHHVSTPKVTSEKQYNLERFFDISPSILCIASHQGILKKVNPAFANILGYTIEEVMQNPVSHYIHPEDREITSKLRHDISKNIPMINFENRYITKTGDVIWLSWTSITEPEDQLIYAVAKDVTQIKKLEDKRNSLLIELTKLNDELKKFAYTTSHDLRSPIDNIISLFGLMDFSKIECKNTLTYIEVFYTSLLKLKQTLNNHLDTLSTKNNINIEVKPIDLTYHLNIVKDSIDELIKNSNANFNVDFSEVKDIHFSPFYLQSILLNLISNSIKYANPNKELLINIKSHRLNNNTQIIFSDNGLGFDLNKAGNNVFSLNQSFHNHKESKGIGLFLVKSHMESLGGTVTVDSTVNKGTTFTLTFKD